MREIEMVQHPQMRGLSVFLDTVEYRTPHLHRELELIWVLDGRMEVHGVQGAFSAAAGDLALFHPKQTHSFRRTDGECTFLCVQASPKLFAYGFPAVEGLRFDQPLLSRCLDRRGLEELGTLLDGLVLPYFQRESGYELLCAGRLHLILYRLLRDAPHHILTEAEALEQERRGERLDRLIDFVEQNHRGRIRLSDFARRENRSMSYLSHFVKENLGQSFQDYVTAVRFQTACALIAAGRERLLDVCTESGFSDYRYFSLAFRQRLGMTPEEYRSRRAAAGESGLDGGLPRPGGARSLERFYTREESVRLYEALRRKMGAPGSG